MRILSLFLLLPPNLKFSDLDNLFENCSLATSDDVIDSEPEESLNTLLVNTNVNTVSTTSSVNNSQDGNDESHVEVANNQTKKVNKVSQVSPSSFILGENYNPSDRLRIQTMIANFKALNKMKEQSESKKHTDCQEKSEESNITLSGNNTTTCSICHKQLNNHSALLRHHQSTHSNTKKFKCDRCGMEFARKDSCERHERSHLKNHHQCGVCKRFFSKKKSLVKHQRTYHGKELF